jgi:Putative NAD(P)-binding
MKLRARADQKFPLPPLPPPPNLTTLVCIPELSSFRVSMSVPLLMTVDCTAHVHLVIGNNGIASKRAGKSLEAGAQCVLISPAQREELHFELRSLVKKGRIRHVQREFCEEDLRRFGREEVDNIIDMVFVTLSPLDKRGTSSASRHLL